MTRLVVAEWLKLRTTWGVWVYLALLLGVTALGVAGTIAADEGGWAPEDTRAVLETPGLATLFVLLLGAVGFTNEFRHGTIGQTFLITPRRERVLGVKLLFFALLGVVFGLVAYALMLAMAIPWLGAKDVDISLDEHGRAGHVHRRRGRLRAARRLRRGGRRRRPEPGRPRSSGSSSGSCSSSSSSARSST